MSADLKKQLTAYAKSLGFERVGIASASPLNKEAVALDAWLAQGYAGDMDYMERDPGRRSDPQKLLPGAKSVIALAMSYFVDEETGRQGDEVKRPIAPSENRIARYARGPDYHRIIGKRLTAFVRYIEALAPDAQCKTFVDAGPLLERPFAQRAGLGFVGKNTMLITRGLGSWIFLAHVLTTAELPADAPDLRSCGSCSLCIDACPTEAIREPFKLDARRCIAYLTIELEGDIPEALRPAMQGWVFGCDVCQEVCPHNTRIPSTTVTEFRERRPPLALAELLSLDDITFSERFAGTPFTRTARAGLVRNACMAAANLQRKDLVPALERLRTADPDTTVRSHAAWAVRQLSGDSSNRSDAKG